MNPEPEAFRPMDVAVIVALYNGADWIRSSLDSVTSQTHSPSELIVVDDGSTDGSRNIVAEEYPEARLVENSGNGPCEARNYGVECASAEKVAFLDQDDLWHKDHLKLIDQAFRVYPESVVAYSKEVRFSNSESPNYSVDGFDPHTYDPWDDYPYDGLGEPIGGVIRRAAFEQVEGWSQALVGGGVHHLWLKLGLLGDFVVTGCRTAAKREHDHQFSENFRQDKAESYFANIIKASEDALRRRRQRGLQIDRFVTRLEAQKSLLDFLKAVSKEDRSEMRRSLRDFGEKMADEPGSVIEGMWSYFWWPVTPVFEQRGFARSAADVVEFTEQWPETLWRPRKFLRDWWVYRASSFELVRLHPANTQYWSLLVRRAIQRFRAQFP